MRGGKGLGSNSYLPYANTVLYSFNHTGEADFKFSVLGCPLPTETHPLDSCLCTPHTPAAPLHRWDCQALERSCRIPIPALEVDELQSSQRAISCPETLTYSREGAEQPLRGGPPTFLWLPGTPRRRHARSTCAPLPIPLPFGTRHRGWSPQRQWRQRAGCLQGNNSALSSVTFGFSTQVSTRCLEKVTGEGGRQKYFVFFQPGWTNSMMVIPHISFLAL